MRSQSLIPMRTMLSWLSGVVIAGSVLMTPAKADLWNKKTVLTVNQTVQVTDTVLQPGQYVLKLQDSQSDRHIVQIFNRDETHIINTVLAIPTQRLQPTGHTQFTFWETPPGTARALRTWYYPGDNFGQEFAYPKHLQTVAMATTGTATHNAAAAEPPASAEPATPPTAMEEQPTAQSEPAQPEQPTEMAQNTNPPADQAPADTTTPQSTPSQPSSLPKTGSPYPAFGLGGAMLLGLAGLLRLRRTA